MKTEFRISDFGFRIWCPTARHPGGEGGGNPKSESGDNK